jgi:hypothetical protein
MKHTSSGLFSMTLSTIDCMFHRKVVQKPTVFLAIKTCFKLILLWVWYYINLQYEQHYNCSWRQFQRALNTWIYPVALVRERTIPTERPQTYELGNIIYNNTSQIPKTLRILSFQIRRINSRNTLINDSRSVQHRLATSRIQQEINEATEREKELQEAGMIQTVSEETVDSKVCVNCPSILTILYLSTILQSNVYLKQCCLLLSCMIIYNLSTQKSSTERFKTYFCCCHVPSKSSLQVSVLLCCIYHSTDIFVRWWNSICMTQNNFLNQWFFSVTCMFISIPEV